MNFIIQIIVGLVLSLASTLIKSIFQQDQKQKVAGVRGTIQTGGDHPLSFIMGFYGTAGHLKYSGTWGNSGDTPNAYFSKAISVSDLPVRGLAGFFVNGKRVTLAASVTGDLGFAVLDYRVGTTDHLWVKFYDGTQTVADPLMCAQFGADALKPYTADMVGRGVAYFVATALVNRELFSGLPEYFAEINGISLDDPRGDNAQENPIVGAYTIFKGISYGGKWVYGPQNVTANNFVYANLEAQMDKCDVATALDGGGTERRFRFGLEVSVDTEPQAIIGELLKGSQGRIAEIGGIYKFLVGEPGDPVASITDEDIIITEGQTYEPFPGLESLFNGMSATYPEPLEAWESKEAPPRYRSDLEVLDDNRRLPFSTEYKSVPFPTQVQRLMRAAIEETRRFRKTTKTMPPEWWEYEPLDSYLWTSVRNGFTDKQFLITAMDDLPNGNQFVGDQEVDPADYGWSISYQLPWDISPLVIARPAPQLMSGWTASPATILDSASTARRPSIEVTAAAGLDDVRAVRVQVRESWSTKRVVFDGDLPYDKALTSIDFVLNGTFLPDTLYEVRGIFVPFSGRVTRWSNQDVDGTEGAWLSVTTPDVRLGPLDIYGFDLSNLSDDITGYLTWNGENTREISRQAEELATAAADETLGNYTQHQQLRREMTLTSAGITASYLEAITVATGPGSAIVSRIEDLEVAVNTTIATAVGLLQTQIDTIDGQTDANATAITALSAGSISGDVATANFRMTASAGPAGYASRIGLEARAGGAGTWRTAALFLDVPSVTSDPTRVVIYADQFVVTDGTHAEAPFVFEAGVAKMQAARIGTITSGRIQNAANTSFFDLTSGAFRISA